ncbi:MAG: HAMP domain-containing sensor histidine kinase [Microbacterium arborescens]
MLSRPRIQPYAQFLMGGSAGLITVTAAVIEPARITPAFVSGLAVILAACVVMAVVWHYKPTRGTVWLGVVPIAAIVACAPVRAGTADIVPFTSMLVVFPIVWLAFAFPPVVTAVGVVFASLLPLAATPAIPTTLGEWMTLLIVPALLGMFAVGSRFVAVDLQRQRTRAQSAKRRLSAAIDSSHRADAALRQLLDTTPEPIVVFDVDGTLLLSNEPSRALARRAGIALSLDQDENAPVFGADRTTRIPLSPALRHDILAGLLAEPRRVWVGRPGEQTALRFVARPIAVDDEPIGVMLLAQDITELVEAVEVRDRFLDTVGHELRTPLTIILGNAELAVATAEHDQRDRWATVLRAGQRLEHTVELMLAAGRAQVEPRPGHADVGTVVDGVIAELADLGDGVSVTVAGASATADIVSGDLASIVAELLRNAREVSQRGGVVRVAMSHDAERVEISVSDDGPGMTETERRQAFERFYRTSRARRSAAQGLGLGLSLSRSLAEAHGGRVLLLPGRSGGTRAVVDLPRADAG